MLRIAVVGIGGYGRAFRPHILSAVDHDMCELVAVADNRLTELGDQAVYLQPYGPEFYTDAIEMLNAHAGKCDAVFLVTAIASHEPLTVAAAQLGYHVWLEKPPAATIQDVDRMITAVEAAGVVCQVAFQWIWSRGINFIKDRVVDGCLGDIQKVAICAAWPRSDYYYSRNAWVGKLRSAGKWVLDGPATNAFAHQTNNLLYLASSQRGGFATPTAVRAELYSARGIECHDTASVEIQTAEGAPLNLQVSHCTHSAFEPTIEVTGDNGTGRWTVADGAVVTYGDGTEERCGMEAAAGKDLMVANFIRAAEAADPSLPRCSLADTRNYALVANGMHESSGLIHTIGSEFLHRSDAEEDKAHTFVEGLDDLLRRAAGDQCLISDLSQAPDWAVATETFDLAGYSEFPRQFRC